MSPRSQYTAKVHEVLMARLDADEPVVARGTGNERRRPSRHVTYGSGDFLLVTPRRLLWSPTGAPRRRATLDFDAVTSWSEGAQYHRYALLLEHAAIERIAWAPAHKVLWIEWGDTEEAKRQTQTFLHFSRQDTAVAVAIRHQLARRKVQRGTPLRFDQRRRSEREGRVLARRSRWRDVLRSRRS